MQKLFLVLGCALILAGGCCQSKVCVPEPDASHPGNMEAESAPVYEFKHGLDYEQSDIPQMPPEMMHKKNMQMKGHGGHHES